MASVICWITVAGLLVKCILCPSGSKDWLSGGVQVGIHHSAVAPGSSSVMDVTAGGLNRAGKVPSRMCGDITASDNSWCHGRTLYVSWSNSFLGMVALVS